MKGLIMNLIIELHREIPPNLQKTYYPGFLRIDPDNLVPVREWLYYSKIKYDAYIEVYETASRNSHFSRSEIVCGLNGEKLRPKHGYDSKNQTDATFWVKECLIVECIWHHSDYTYSGTVKLIRVNINPIYITSYLLWRFGEKTGVSKLTPTGLKFPEKAIEAAKEKAKNWHVHRAYYCEGPNE